MVITMDIMDMGNVLITTVVMVDTIDMNTGDITEEMTMIITIHHTVQIEIFYSR